MNLSAQASCHPWLTEPGTQIGEGIFLWDCPESGIRKKVAARDEKRKCFSRCRFQMDTDRDKKPKHWIVVKVAHEFVTGKRDIYSKFEVKCVENMI